MALSFRREIAGKPYSFIRIDGGWQVTCLASPTDHFHKSYFVQTETSGKPLKCSCPDCYHRQSWCKHLKEVEAWFNSERAARKLANVK